MEESLVFAGSTALINYTKSYPRSAAELLSREEFSQFLQLFLCEYAKKNPENERWVARDLPPTEIRRDLLRLFKGLLVLEPEEIQHPYLNDRQRLLQLIEDGYHFWRNMQRISIVTTHNEAGLQLANFIEADMQFNQMILQFYRTIQQKVQGYENRVFRQLQAGTNAAILLRDYRWTTPAPYQALQAIPLINQIMLRTPLLIHPKSNKREGLFAPCENNPIEEFTDDPNHWMGYPCKVGRLLIYVYFHRDFTGSAVALANLFELADAKDCLDRQPDGLVLFGNPDGKQDTVFYHDRVHSIWVGKVSYDERIEYFGYLKKMVLTLHNLCVMEQGWLPLHGAMVELWLKDGSRKGVVLIGDSGAGKSETIEALGKIQKEEIVKQEIIFDDMGSLHIENGEVVAQGTEIGAFVRLDDLDKGSAYRDMDRSIFFNPESANARVVIPSAPYKTIVANHKVDLFLYANNYTDRRGLTRFFDQKKAKAVFIEGKRMALGTTQEVGLSSTYFANPFGPMQAKETCGPILDAMFEQLFENEVLVGEIYTCLGLKEKSADALSLAAESLLEAIKK